MSEEKYCPINSHPQSDGMCKKDKCAWWVRYREGGAVVREGCAIAFIASQKLPILFTE